MYILNSELKYENLKHINIQINYEGKLKKVCTNCAQLGFFFTHYKFSSKQQCKISLQERVRPQDLDP